MENKYFQLKRNLQETCRKKNSEKNLTDKPFFFQEKKPLKKTCFEKKKDPCDKKKPLLRNKKNLGQKKTL